MAGSWANVMGEAGYHDTAVALAREAWRGPRELGLTRDDVSRHHVAAARASLARGRIIRGLVAAARAVRWQPALPGRMVRGGFRRIARWVRRRGDQPEM